MSAEVSLIDEVLACAVKHGAPLFQFSDAVGGFLGVVFCHTPVCKPLASFHRVVEMDLPAIPWVCVLQSRCTAAFGHDCVRFTEQGFGDDGRFSAASCAFNGGPKACAACTNDDDIVLVVGNVLVHSLTSNNKKHHVIDPALCD